DDALEDLVVHDARHPPRALRPHLVPDDVAVITYRLGGEADRLVEQRLMAVIGEDQRKSLAERRSDSRRAETGAHDFVHQLSHVFVGERLERPGVTAGDLERDDPAL